MTGKFQDRKIDLIDDKYTPKRKRLEEIIKLAYGRVTEKTLVRMRECSTFMQFIATKDKSHKKVVGSNSCGNRFCPICNWNKARKDGVMLSVLMQAIKNELNYEYIFLTLTVPNVPSIELESEIKHLNQSFKRLSETKQFKQSVKGYVRKMEVTYNSERDDYHPHFHVLLAVNKSYFTDAKSYINRDLWLEMWKSATRYTDITQVDVRKVTDKKGDTAFKEMAKYSTKDSDMIFNQEVFDTLYYATKGKRLIVYSGIFKDYKKKYESKQLEQYKKIDENIYYWFIRSTWNRETSKYDSVFEELSELDKAKFNNQKIDELSAESID